MNDVNHWFNREPPFCPNKYEVEMYKHHIKGYGPICLLGMTKELQPLCDFMMDINPIQQEKPVVNMNWNDYNNTIFSEAIIGDGVLNLEGIQLAQKLRKYCKKLVCRVFLKKFDWMKYAEHFPTEFPGANLVVPTQENISMVVWEQ